MAKVNSKCPKCGEGIMKLQVNTTELSPIVPPAGLVRAARIRNVVLKIKQKISLIRVEHSIFVGETSFRNNAMALLAVVS